MNIPPQLKGLTAYVKRAEELDKETSNPDARVVAYFCRTFAVDRGIKLKAEGPEVHPFLMALMNLMDKDKTCVVGVSSEERKLICERFAYNVFTKADDEDRAGLADKNTAKTFYAAATFLEILEQFGELDSDVVEKKRYAKWKAADIITCIKNGVKPTPGGPNEIPADGDEGATVSSVPLIPAAPTDAPIAPVVLPSVPFSNSMSPVVLKPEFMQPTPVQQPPMAPVVQPVYAPVVQPTYAPVSTPAPALAPAVVQARPAYNPTPAPAPIAARPPPASVSEGKTKDAIELCSFAIAALKHNDTALARERLQLALQRLG